MVEFLKTELAGYPNLEVQGQDALQYTFEDLPEHTIIVANLPYNISTPLLFRLMQYAPCIRDMLFMLQREVVLRMTATPGGKTYGRLTVMLAAVARIERLFDVGRGAFTPPPRVDSAIVRLVPHREPPFPVPDRRLFATIVATAFSHRRKTLRNALAGLVTADDIENAGLDPGVRPEVVDPEGFSALAVQIHKGRQPSS